MIEFLLIALAAFLAGCVAICLAYYFLEVWGTPPEDPQTQPPTDFLSESPEEARKLWQSINPPTK